MFISSVIQVIFKHFWEFSIIKLNNAYLDGYRMTHIWYVRNNFKYAGFYRDEVGSSKGDDSIMVQLGNFQHFAILRIYMNYRGFIFS